MLEVASSRHRDAAQFSSWNDVNLVIGMTLWIASQSCLRARLYRGPVSLARLYRVQYKCYLVLDIYIYSKRGGLHFPHSMADSHTMELCGSCCSTPTHPHTHTLFANPLFATLPFPLLTTRLLESKPMLFCLTLDSLLSNPFISPASFPAKSNGQNSLCDLLPRSLTISRQFNPLLRSPIDN